MTNLLQNLRYALRQLQRSPGFTAVAVLSLALGIGANAGIFSLFEQALLRPLPVQEPARLVNLAAPGPKSGSMSCGQAGGCDAIFSYPMFRDLEAAQEPFAGLAAHVQFGASLAIGDQTMMGDGVLVSGSYFGVLGLRPALGRLLGPEDDRVVDGEPVAVLGHGFWENRLGADPGVLNESIVVNGQLLTIVGVAPAGFSGVTLGSRPDVFVPITMRGLLNPGSDPGFENRRVYWAYLFARLKPGVSMEEAAQSVNLAYRPIINEVEAPLQSGMSDQSMSEFRAKEVSLEDGRRGQSTFDRDARMPLTLLFATTAIVLLITCANIANLLLARGATRGQELAVRGSLGARRSQLVGQLLTEACLLALLGGAASLLMARWTLAFIGSFLPPDVAAVLDLQLHPRVLVFAAAVSIGTGVLFGMYPALHATRRDLITALRSNAAQPSGARSAARFRTSLVTAQIALSMALLVSAGLFVRSLMNVSRVDLGFRSENIASFDIYPALSGYDAEATHALLASVEDELAAVPGVTDASAAVVAVIRDNSWGNDVSVQGFESGPDVNDNARTNLVSPNYFATLGIPLLAGRDFEEADRLETPKVAIVNQAFARHFGLDEGEVVGTRMAIGDTNDLDMEIVGLVGDASYNNVKEDVPPMYFTPWRQTENLVGLTFYARTGIEPSSVLSSIPALIRRFDPHLPVENRKTMRQQVRENVFLDRMISTLSATFAGLATLLAAVGLFGVMAYTVAQRTREIGLRMALGAGSGRVRALVLGQVGRMTLVGGVIGIVGALILGRVASSLLFGIEGFSLLAIVAAALVLSLVALVAGYLPARRAARVDPMVALRAE